MGFWGWWACGGSPEVVGGGREKGLGPTRGCSLLQLPDRVWPHLLVAKERPEIGGFSVKTHDF